MSSQYFGSIVYSKFIFDVPKLIDICTVYGQSNVEVRALVSKLVETVLTSNPKYNKDLGEALNSFASVFEDIKANLGLCGGLMGSRLPLMDWLTIRSSVHIIADTCVAISSFISIYPAVAEQCREMGFEGIIASFYETAFAPLQEELEHRFEANRDEA